MDLTI